MSCALALYMKNHIFVFIGDTLSDQVRVLNLSQNGLKPPLYNRLIPATEIGIDRSLDRRLW